MSQIHYMLGDNNYIISYLIDFGSNFPRNPHHRGRFITNFVAVYWPIGKKHDEKILAKKKSKAIHIVF